MPDIKAQIILDSAHPQGQDYRLTTFLCRYPKFVHAEHMRHRTGSYCVSSSRAVPVSKNLEEVRSDELRAGPVFWGAEQRGMQSGEELPDIDENDPSKTLGRSKQYAINTWRQAAKAAAYSAENLMNAGVHKSIVNRLLEPFLHVNVLVTSCAPGLLNFFGLRLDKAAQPEIKALAEGMWKVWNESKPKLLKPGMWHLPFFNDEDGIEVNKLDTWVEATGQPKVELARRISTARCARLSYTSFETNKRSTIEEDLKLYDRLIGSKPIHASPAEHQATPDMYERYQIPFPHQKWSDPHLHGNLLGWIQHRKLLPNEAIAALPEGYTL